MSASAIVFTAVRVPQEVYRRAISEVLPEAGDALQARTLSWDKRPSQRESIDVPAGYVRASPRDREARMRRTETDASRVQ
jgi:hypothetical protein